MSSPDEEEARQERGETRGGPGSASRSGSPVPRWLPPLLYALLTVVLFRAFVFSDGFLFGTDTVSLGYVAREFYAHAVKVLGIFPLWNPHILGGTPFVDSLIGGDIFYPTTLLKFGMETYRALGWKLVIHVFLAGVFTYGWLRTVDRSRVAAALGGVAYMLAPFLVTLVYPGHDGKLFVTALTPLLFLFTERYFRVRRWSSAVPVALVVALVILTPQFQMAYFLFFGVGAYALFRAARAWRREGGAATAGRALAPYLVAAVLGAGVASAQLVPAFTYVTEFSRRTATTTRAEERTGAEYSSSWSLHPEEVGALVVPEFVGSDAGGAEWTTGTYWGRNPFKLNHEYAGLVVLLLAPLAFVGRGGEAEPEEATGAGGEAETADDAVEARPRRLFFAGLGLVTLAYTLGQHTPVWRLFYEMVPGISLFRAPSMVVFLFGFSAVTLFAGGVDALKSVAARAASARGEAGTGSAGEGGEGGRTAREVRRITWWLWGATGALAVLALLAGGGVLTDAWTSLLYGGMSPQKAAALQRARPFIARGFWIATFLAAAVAGAWHLARRGPGPRRFALAGLALLVIADLWRVDAPFIQVVDPAPYVSPGPVEEYLMERAREEPPSRLFSVRSGAQDVHPAAFGLDLVAGHHPNDLARYRELIGMRGSGLPENLIRSGTVRRLLNVRYLLVPAEMGTSMGGEPLMETSRAALYPLPEPLPRAFLVARATVLPDSEAVAYITGDRFDPGAEAVLPAPPPAPLGGGRVEGGARWEERGINRMRLTTTSDRAALLVLGENWYPAWHARVDGEPSPVLRANHTLRAVPVPAGRHEVELFYSSGTLRLGLWIAAGSLLVLAVTGLLSRRRRRTEGDGAAGPHG